jgi:hypothetical protein
MKQGITEFTKEFIAVRSQTIQLQSSNDTLTCLPNHKNVGKKANVLTRYLQQDHLDEKELSFARGLIGEEFLRHVLLYSLYTYNASAQVHTLAAPCELDPTQTGFNVNGVTTSSRGGDIIITRHMPGETASFVPILLVDATVSTGKTAKKSHKVGGINALIDTPVIVMALPRIQYGDHTALTHYLDKYAVPSIQQGVYDPYSPLEYMQTQYQGEVMQSLFWNFVTSIDRTREAINDQRIPQEIEATGLERLQESRYMFSALYEDSQGG